MNSSNSVDINGNKIRLIREQKGLTQLYLATVVGVTTDTISRWENRRYPSIKLENAKKLAEALEISLEELLEDNGEDAAVDAPEGTEQIEGEKTIPIGPTTLFWAFVSRRRTLIGLCGGCLVLAGLVAAVLLLVNRSGINAVRIMPKHTAPNLPFPVIIQVSGEMEAMNTVLIREELQGDGEATGASAEGPPKQFGKNPRWIGKLQNGKAAFLYLVEPGKKVRPDDEIRISGDLIATEGQSIGDSIDGPSRIVIAPYHWADSDKDYVISDTEIRKAYETYSITGENLINFTALEELWMAGGYAWNKKTQTCTPAPPVAGKE
jgi:transcriptional regulator with XRE-family HTH domain